MEVLLLFAGLLLLLCMFATLRCISQRVLPTHHHPIQAADRDSCRVITVVTPNITYILQQCTATTQTEASVQGTDANTSTQRL